MLVIRLTVVLCTAKVGMVSDSQQKVIMSMKININSNHKKTNFAK